MYIELEDRFEPINFKNQKLVQGDYVTTESGTLLGYMTNSLAHLVDAGIDTTDVSATIITNGENASLVKKGYLVEVDGEYTAITKIIRYRDPFGSGYDTFEVLV